LNSSNDAKERAAILLYVNRHSFNGLIRYNSRGEFNVPFGKYAKPYFPFQELISFYKQTQSTETKFIATDFRSIFACLEPGDVVYCDPPYVPLSQTSKFTAYSGNIFQKQDQRDLALLAQNAWKKDIYIVLSNHDTEITRKLYSSAILKYFTVQRFISCDGDKREKVPELLAIYR
jgi:DNA adenine methylase